MPEKLTPETEERIRELCRKISVAHNLDEEIQRELFSHMEVKLLGYLSGEEKVTEEDALILVREHFGDPEYIRSLLEEVHSREVHISFVRKLGAIFVLTFFTTYLLNGYLGLIMWKVFTIGQYGLTTTRMEYLSAFILTVLLSYSLFGCTIYHWRKGMENGRKQWFETLNPWLFLIFVISIICFLPLILTRFVSPHYNWTYSSHKLENFFFPASWTIVCLVWIWWFNKPFRRLRFIFLGFFTWYYIYIGWQFTISNIGIMVRQDPERTLHYFIQFTSMYLSNFYSSPLHLIKYQIPQCGLAAVGLYLIVTKIYNWRRKTGVVVIPR